MSSFLDLNVADAQDYKTEPEGEYQLRVGAAEVKTSQKTGGQYIGLVLTIIGGSSQFLKDVNHTLMLPTPKDDVKQANNRKIRIRDFMVAFGLDINAPIDIEAWVGQTGWALLTEEDGGDFGMQNRLKKVITGR